MQSLRAQSNIERERPPWETAPFGVVSLLEMLKFAAEDFWEAAEIIGRISENPRYTFDYKPRAQRVFAKLMIHCKELGLKGSVKYLVKMQEGVDLDVATGFPTNFNKEIQTLSSIIEAELGARMFRYIQSEKSQYCDPDWLVGTPIQDKFPRAFNEFQAGGRCYAYGENTACAFHLNRVLEDGLKALAVALGQPFDRNSWDAHLKDVERELTVRYKSAGARTVDELFYSDLSTQFGHLKTAWRNPTMHIEAKYDERDGLYLLQTTERFVFTLCERGLQQGDLPLI